MSVWGSLDGDEWCSCPLRGVGFSSFTLSTCSWTVFFLFFGWLRSTCSPRLLRSSGCSVNLSGSAGEAQSGRLVLFPGHDKQKMTPPARRNPAEMNVTHRAPPGWYLLLSGRSVVRKAVMTSLVNQDAGTTQRRLARMKQPPAAMAVCPFALWLPPQRVHLSPKVARQSPNSATTQDRTMPVRAACRCGGSDSTEFFTVQLKTPELYHTQSIHRPCICDIGVMMLVHTLMLTFQLGIRVATTAPRTPRSARANARIWIAADSMAHPPYFCPGQVLTADNSSAQAPASCNQKRNENWSERGSVTGAQLRLLMGICVSVWGSSSMIACISWCGDHWHSIMSL